MHNFGFLASFEKAEDLADLVHWAKFANPCSKSVSTNFSFCDPLPILFSQIQVNLASPCHVPKYM